MIEQEGGAITIGNPLEIEEMLEKLTQPGAASLVLDKPGSEPLPVVLAKTIPGEALVLDVSAIREVVAPLQRGTGLRLLGQGLEGMVRTPMLTVSQFDEVEGRMQCHCNYPTELHLFQRRDDYRATPRLGMEVGVLLRDLNNPATFQGDLRDLSMNGCLVEVLPNMSELVALNQSPLELEFCFPNGLRFVIRATPRHHMTDAEREVLAVGFAFEPRSVDQDRQLWFFVREIEREAARSASVEATSLAPSQLFQANSSAPTVGLRHALRYATPMTRRLARVAGFLDQQVLELRDGRPVGSVPLSHAADRLLALLEEDREAVLFALQCLGREPQLVQHSLCVAVRLVDIGRAFKMPREVQKALAASALVHDLGKALLPVELLQNPDRSADQERQYQAHVELILPQLEACHWLSVTVIQAVVEGANERLDGSGYPRQWQGDQLHELTRLAAVVKIADRLSRPGPAGPGMTVDRIRDFLEQRPQQFDARWVTRYFEHFGELPVGTLLRYPAGELAWVQRLDSEGRPARVQLAASEGPLTTWVSWWKRAPCCVWESHKRSLQRRARGHCSIRDAVPINNPGSPVAERGRGQIYRGNSYI
ncbi:HD domain-containing phosphohydrolase [Kineobactrum salinum]|uniref:HD domain-containing protein n=1 Tax=Kineobactrum salinum TaxID=2708301 RepID=A0A6C0U4D8_9GAMM|nr:HD domain-containing phosphohydrolase [Kineobactrum salinum]QIB64314.1 HD domain-containing protein [Kineobactrum salinum]